ncbi:MAG: glycosyltransferase [Paludibacteraceae bacterium]|nr:glycosyltransferase [Paludibacteraceae bacterium]
MSIIRLSIIIPFYNVEKYIAACLDSVVNQDIPLSEYEIICVNDASPDHSRDIVLEYMKRYSNIRLIEHEHNMKLGAARNTGRSIARGKYIWNVDSDDMIFPKCLKDILENCEKYDLDVLEMGYVNLFGKISGSISHSQIPRDKAIYSGPDYLEKFHIDKMHTICGIWRKVYKRSFLYENSIYSPPINMGEDEAFAIEVFGTAKRMSYLNKDCYIYRRTVTSLSGEYKQNWDWQKLYEASMVCSRYMHNSLSKVKSNYSPIVYASLKGMITYEILQWYSFMDCMTYSTMNEFWGHCRKHFFDNLFVFHYLSRKKTLLYICHCLKCC